MTESVDLTRGLYRRQYGGFIYGKRINKLSLKAEAWFWRVHRTVDDFGNYYADPELLFDATKGRRQRVTVKQVAEWIDEMYEAGLIAFYWIRDEKFLHINLFPEWQPPAGRNSRRISRVPQPLGPLVNSEGSVQSGTPEHPTPIPNTNTDSDTEHEPPFGGTAFLEAWAAWESHKKEKRSKLTTGARKLIFGRFRKWGEERATAAIYYSIEKNWQGIFEEKGTGTAADNSKVAQTIAAGERVRAKLREEQDERSRREL